MKAVYLVTLLLIILISQAAIIQPSSSDPNQTTLNSSNNNPPIQSNIKLGNLTLDQLSNLINNMLAELNSTSNMNNSNTGIAKLANQSIISSLNTSTNSQESKPAQNITQLSNQSSLLINLTNPSVSGNNMTKQLPPPADKTIPLIVSSVNLTTTSNTSGQASISSNLQVNDYQNSQSNTTNNSLSLNSSEVQNNNTQQINNASQVVASIPEVLKTANYTLNSTTISNNSALNQSSTSNQNIINNIISNNYFSYFMGPNAAHSGNLFSNANNNSQNTSSLQNNGRNNNNAGSSTTNIVDNQTVSNMAISTDNNSSSQNTISSQNNASIIVTSPFTASLSTQTSLSTTSTSNNISVPQNINSGAATPIINQPVQNSSPNLSSSSQDLSQNGNLNSLSLGFQASQTQMTLCMTDSQCLLTYSGLLGSSLSLICKGGVCVPVY